MICKYCKNEIADNSKFCGFCGHRLDAAEKQSEKANQETQNTDSQKVYSNVSFDSDNSQAKNNQQEQKTANNCESTSYSNVSFENAPKQTNSKVNKPKRNFSFHLSDSTKKVINFILVIAIFISIGLGYLTVAFRYFTSPDSVNTGLSQTYFRDAEIEPSNGKKESVSKYILDEMGDYFSEDLDITEEDVIGFFMDFDVKKSVAKLYYKSFMQHFCIDKVGLLTADDFVDVFRENPEAIKSCFDIEFDEDDYGRLAESFEYGFFGDLTTTDVLVRKYPLQFTNAIFSEQSTWFCISLLLLSCCVYLLINEKPVLKLLKLLYKELIAVSITFTVLLIYLKFIERAVYADGLMMTYLIPLIIASIILGIRRLRYIFTRPKEIRDKEFEEECERVFGKDEDGETENEQQT